MVSATENVRSPVFHFIITVVFRIKINKRKKEKKKKEKIVPVSVMHGCENTIDTIM